MVARMIPSPKLVEKPSVNDDLVVRKTMQPAYVSWWLGPSRCDVEGEEVK